MASLGRHRCQETIRVHGGRVSFLGPGHTPRKSFAVNGEIEHRILAESRRFLDVPGDFLAVPFEATTKTGFKASESLYSKWFLDATSTRLPYT